MSNQKQQLYQHYQIPFQCKGNQTRHDPNAIDVDAQWTRNLDISDISTMNPNIEMDAYRTGPDGRPIFSNKQKDALRVLEGCYCCRMLRHISMDCKKFPPLLKNNLSGVTFPNRGCGQGWQPCGGGGNRGGLPGPRAVWLEPKEEKPTWTKENLTRDHLDQVVMGIEDIEERTNYLENLFRPDF